MRISANAARIVTVRGSPRTITPAATATAGLIRIDIGEDHRAGGPDLADQLREDHERQRGAAGGQRDQGTMTCPDGGVAGQVRIASGV